ncbi:hypothetical protein GCM10007941_15230 [Amphritea balenae]|nr:hypothetical protein GCM10007941_15230 [Amphritea balenae]
MFQNEIERSGQYGFDSLDEVVLEAPKMKLGFDADPQGKLSVILKPSSLTIEKYGVSADAYNAWNRKGIYVDAVVKDDGEITKIAYRPAYPMFWHNFRNSRKESNDAAAIPWLGYCNTLPKSETQCFRVISHLGIASEIRYPESHIGNIDRIVSAYKELLDSWAV